MTNQDIENLSNHREYMIKCIWQYWYTLRKIDAFQKIEARGQSEIDLYMHFLLTIPEFRFFNKNTSCISNRSGVWHFIGQNTVCFEETRDTLFPIYICMIIFFEMFKKNCAIEKYNIIKFYIFRIVLYFNVKRKNHILLNW